MQQLISQVFLDKGVNKLQYVEQLEKLEFGGIDNGHEL